MTAVDEYDVVVLLQLHGVHDLTEALECPLRSIPEGRQVTLLEGTPCGAINLVDPEFANYTRDFFDVMVKIKDKKCDKEVALQVQTLLRNIKKSRLKNPSPALQQMLNGDDLQKQEANEYLRTPGWDLITSGVEYVDKRYGIDRNWPFSAVVIYSKNKDIPVNTQLIPLVHNPYKRGSPLTRQGLIDYCFLHGSRHVMLIDASCGNINTRSSRVSRTISRKRRKTTESGGRRKTKLIKLKRRYKNNFFTK